MANYKAVTNGAWSNLATWQDNSGGSFAPSTILPGINDYVYSNNCTVSIDQTVSILRFLNKSTTGIVSGGKFNITASCTIICSETVIGYVENAEILNINNNGITVNIYSNLQGGANLPLCLIISANATVNIFGNQIGGGNNSASAVSMTSQCTVNIFGNQIGGTNLSHGINILAAAGAVNLTITGNQNAGNAAAAIYNASNSSTISINGNQSGGANSGIYSVGVHSIASSLTIVGNQIGGSASSAIHFTGNILDITGIATAGAYSAIYSTGTVKYTGNVVNILGVNAIFSLKLYLCFNVSTQYIFQDYSGSNNVLYPAGVNTGHPIEADVKKDVVYGPNNEFEGTLIQPPFTIPDFIAALKADDLGIRLGKCATTEEVDSTVAAYNT